MDLSSIAGKPVRQWKELLHNAFERYAFEEIPVLQKIKDSLYSHDACFASLSGSGSALYGIFRQPDHLPPELMTYLVWSGWC